MTVYDTRKRCVYCRQFDLPCNDAVHGNELFPYLGGLENLAVPYVPGQNEPAIRPAAPPTPADSRAARAQTLTTVALILIMLAAGIVALGTYAWLFHPFGQSCDRPPCAAVEFASTPPGRPPWQ
jgi:hypothetical protein